MSLACEPADLLDRRPLEDPCGKMYFVNSSTQLLIQCICYSALIHICFISCDFLLGFHSLLCSNYDSLNFFQAKRLMGVFLILLFRFCIMNSDTLFMQRSTKLLRIKKFRIQSIQYKTHKYRTYKSRNVHNLTISNKKTAHQCQSKELRNWGKQYRNSQFVFVTVVLY